MICVDDNDLENSAQIKMNKLRMSALMKEKTTLKESYLKVANSNNEFNNKLIEFIDLKYLKMNY